MLNYTKVKKEHCALLSIEKQVIAVNFFHYKSALPKTLKDSIPCSQALHTKCSKTSEVIKHLKDLKDGFIKKDLSIKISRTPL